MSPLFSVKNLSIHRAGIRILDGINWIVNVGEHWVILGANGSGKTSLLKALTGYMTPTGGEITILGEEYGGSDWRISKLAGKKQAPALVLVTHHIEEIIPEFTHVLALRRGRIAYSGPKSRGLEAEMLATVFNARLVIRKSASRYHLRGIS